MFFNIDQFEDLLNGNEVTETVQRDHKTVSEQTQTQLYPELTLSDEDDGPDDDPLWVPYRRFVKLRAHRRGITCIVVNQQGTKLFTGGQDCQFRQWEFNAMKQDMKPTRSDQYCKGTAPSCAAIGKSSLYIGAGDHTIRIVNGVTGATYGQTIVGDPYISNQSIVKGHTGKVTCVVPHPTQPTQFFTAAEDGTVRLFDEKTPKEGMSRGIPCSMVWQSIQPEKAKQRSGIHSLLVLHSNDEDNTHEHDETTKNSNLLILAGCNDGSIQLFNYAKTTPIAGGVYSSTMCAITTLTAVPGFQNLIAARAEDGELFIVDYTTMEKNFTPQSLKTNTKISNSLIRLADFQTLKSSPQSICFSPDNRQLLMAVSVKEGSMFRSGVVAIDLESMITSAQMKLDSTNVPDGEDDDIEKLYRIVATPTGEATRSDNLQIKEPVMVKEELHTSSREATLSPNVKSTFGNEIKLEDDAMMYAYDHAFEADQLAFVEKRPKAWVQYWAAEDATAMSSWVHDFLPLTNEIVIDVLWNSVIDQILFTTQVGHVYFNFDPLFSKKGVLSFLSRPAPVKMFSNVNHPNNASARQVIMTDEDLARQRLEKLQEQRAKSKLAAAQNSTLNTYLLTKTRTNEEEEQEEQEQEEEHETNEENGPTLAVIKRSNFVTSSHNPEAQPPIKKSNTQHF